LKHRTTAVAVLAALVFLGFWVVSSVALDGEPVICPDGEPPTIDFDAEPKEPSPREVFEAQRDLPQGKRAVFNEYTGEFQAVDAVGLRAGDTTVAAQKPLVYKCGPNDEPVLVPLSEADPEAAEDARRRLEQQLGNVDELTGLGEDPAKVARSSPSP